MIKLIVWDLDDTLWRGTLADGETVSPYHHRIELIRQLDRHGIVSSICSNNDAAVAETCLRDLGWWDDFVFPRIAFAPKAQAIAELIADMQLRSANVLFVDDNLTNLAAVRFHLPDITTLDITEPGADTFLLSLLMRQSATKSRRIMYRALESRRNAQVTEPALSQDQFLRSCEIKVTAPFLMENLDHVERIFELMQRSNQLNYTQSRASIEQIQLEIIDVLSYISLAIFASDRHGDYGLVGFVMVEHEANAFRLRHCVFSCRVMHMGLERYALDHLRERAKGLYPPIATIDLGPCAARLDMASPDWIENCRYDDAARAKMATMIEAPAGQPDIRIMFNCQSGGIAHYSSLRHRILFDSYPNVFMLRSFWDESFRKENLPPYLVYGIGIDYLNNPWQDLSRFLDDGGSITALENPSEDLAPFLDLGLYEKCAQRLCDLLCERGIQMLVVLPHERMSPEKYHPQLGQTVERIGRFNAMWRRAFEIYPNISLIDSDLGIPETQMKDANHYQPSALRILANFVDDWIRQVSVMQAKESADLAA